MGYVQPWVVFLGSVETNERKFLAELLENDRLKSRYKRLVEPAGGASQWPHWLPPTGGT